MSEIVGASYNLDVREADVQRTINLMPIVSESEGAKAVTSLQSTPGLVLFSVTVLGYLLQETGDYLLQENAGRIVLE